jgi:hypothetical protein
MRHDNRGGEWACFSCARGGDIELKNISPVRLRSSVEPRRALPQESSAEVAAVARRVATADHYGGATPIAG